MGLFSTRRVTVVGTSVARVISDAYLPDSGTVGTLRGIIGETSIGEEIVDAALNGIGVKANQLYNFGKSNYIYGLPTGSITSNSQGSQEARTIIEAIEGKPISILYSRLGNANLLHYAWMKLIKDYGYSPETNTLNVTVDHEFPQGYPIPAEFDRRVFLHDIALVVDSVDDTPEMTEMWGTPASAGVSHFREPDALAVYAPIITGAYDGVEITVRYLLHVPDYMEGSSSVRQYRDAYIRFPLPEVASEDDFMHVKYQVDGKTKYWVYQLGQGTYPTLDALIDAPPVTTGSFFPMCYFRFDKQRLDRNTSSQEYKQSKKYCDFLGLDFDDVVETIHSGEGRTPEDIEDLEQALMMFAVPANSKDPEELKYIWEFMNNWHLQTEGKRGDPSVDAPRLQPNQQYDDEADGLSVTKDSIIIEDKKFKMALSNGGMYKEIIAKNIGPVGTVTLTRGETYTERNVRVGDSAEEWEWVPQQVKIMTHVYSKQITNQYVEVIHVLSLAMLYHVWGKYTALGNDEEDNLMIPVDKVITDRMRILNREVFFGRSLHFVFNTRTIIKIRWYQTTFFSLLITLVAAVVSTLIGLVDGGQLFLAAVGGSVLAATVIINSIVISMITSLGMQFAFSLVAENISGNLALIIALSSFAVGMVGSFSGMISTPTADMLLTLSNGMSSASSEAYANETQVLQNSLVTFLREHDESMEEINEMLTSMDRQMNRLSPFVIFGESPDDFYNRTIHIGNIGAKSVEFVSEYVANALRLPELSDSFPYTEVSYE